ncbi:hypothetical protein FDL08_19205 [Salmonella enterica]|uniref:Uncharacterized protein n=24 Tax=Salmonella enterica I TaxID=59201 RepID=A0A725GVS7_SALMO|nr:hypothetical protein [Salmonella enterica]EAQ4212872.1 hypothetical protein [Salmonella enterica subsp. enterica serovar Limete]EAS0588072.1 hypothetical protein [Salmonella enterica subsp. enterica serovar Clackamas]EAS0614305.1 hypothetical protein [Salmonella enterica subsp. enterica serovar Dahomey]EAS0642911.1 hypothetical protein [Salmonella enterica subsp. enterica serovar Cotham]EAT8420361.1 hypothetical protein [Salmonella enterica subsp. enterica serovar Chester]EAV6142252.1 hypo
MFHLLERSIEAGCTGRPYQMPENTHRNRVTHDMFLIIFYGRDTPSVCMSLKITQPGNLITIAAVGCILAISTLMK